jgi:hypothetical protein
MADMLGAHPYQCNRFRWVATRFLPPTTIQVDEYKELKNPLIVEKVELEQKITSLQKTQAKRLEPLKAFILQANQAEKLACSGNSLEMKSFLQAIGSNRLLDAQTLTVSFKKPWNLLAETVAAVRNVEPVSARNSIWWRFLNNVRTGFENDPLPGLSPVVDARAVAATGSVWNIGAADGTRTRMKSHPSA